MTEDKQPRYEDSNLYKIRHSTAHVMAQAVLDMFPKGKVAIGPPIADGFYYDFDLPRTLTPVDLKAIEKRMRNIIKKKHSFTRRELSAEEAKQFFAGQPYKIELIKGLEAGGFDEYGNPLPETEQPIITTYRQDSFEDLCRGPHVEHLGKINPKTIKLLNVAGAYWRGDEKRPMLQRIYGTAWETVAELKDYLWKQEEARKRDHRRLGRELDLYSISDKVGPGLILWHPKGGIIRKLIEDYWSDEHEKSGYDFVYTPHIGKAKLWETSGHLDYYQDGMFSPMDIDGQQYYLKPMNCPFHVEIYNNRLRSYRELPLRFGEKGTVYRYERSGVLHGLLRVRGFTQDDAHHFCSPDQMPQEIDFVLNFCLHILRAFGLTDFVAYLSTKPEKSVGDPDKWDKSEVALEEALKRAELPYKIDKGGGAFYGPKIDLAIKDALGREWQMSTIQFDFNLPERFDMSFIGTDGKEHRPYMIHRALLGSMERFFGVMIEHYGGAFPVWLAPVQAILIPIADRHNEYAKQMVTQLKEAGLRAEVDDSGERMGNKIRKAQGQKIPYMLVVGDQEAVDNTLSIRLRTGEKMDSMSVDSFINHISQVITAKKQL